ncbi:MAG: VCBS repeat-containing protein [Tannerellaceae bacterium]|nr:VCBS repeat-containing protein [Tannerellaceae bacterium]
MTPESIDLANYIVPPLPGVGAVTYETVGTTLYSQAKFELSGSTATFTPFPAVGTVTFSFRVRQDAYEAIGTVNVSVYDFDGYPGLMDPFQFSTCYDYMGAVQFTSSIRFMTNYYGGAPTSVWPGAYRVNGTTDQHYRVYGFQTPLVADFDNDGYPEIVALGMVDNQTGNGHIRYIDIYDGRTGQNKVRHTAHTSDVGISGSHPSPGLMAIIDSNRDGTKEIFVAWPGSGSTDANNLVKYEVLTSGTWSLSRQWGVQWYTSGYARYPVVQVVDFDGDGTPEILVYNRIYDAVSGALRMTMETFAPSALDVTSGAFTGRNGYDATSYDDVIGFAYVYDVDLDGRYDICAGDKIYYDIRPAAGTFKVLQRAASGIRDGRTGVADMDGDGIPDIVVARRTSGSSVTLSVWNPGFLSLDGSGNVIKNYTPDAEGRNATAPASFSPYSVSPNKSISISDTGTGSNSYIYIGDIDGRVQTIGGKEYRLPEVAFLSGRITYEGRVNYHPNIQSGISIPNSGSSNGSGVEGVLAAYTIDLADSKKLKLSFILEHDDSSVNTGFTMFDFDNDGMQEICYRDEYTLRIIKANKDYVPLGESLGNTILFSVPCISYTGFESPIIADIDGDNSAEMVVVGKSSGSRTQYFGYIYAVGNGSGAKFAPALPVWNQLLYDPFKINPEDLTTRLGMAPNRLDPKYDFVRQIKDANGVVTSTRTGYKPFNGTMIQATKLDAQAIPLYEPIVFLTEAYIISDLSDAKKPKIVSSGNNHYIELTVGNKSTSKTSILSGIPIAVYTKNTISEATYSASLSKTLGTVYNQGTTTTLGPTFSLAPGQEKTVWIPIGTGAIPGPGDAIVGDVYIVRLGDASGGNPWVWRFGYNGGKFGTTYPCGDFDEGLGQAAATYRDCDWCDQVVRAARYQTLNDLYTIQEYTDVTMNIMGNDILPNVPLLSDPSRTFMDTVRLDHWNIDVYPSAGILSFNGVVGAGARITYHHDNRASLPANIDSFRYKLTYYNDVTGAIETKSSTAYIYILKGVGGGFSSCYGSTTRIELENKPNDVSFEWYRNQYSSEKLQANSRVRLTGIMYSDSTYWLDPVLTGITATSGLTTAQINHYKTLNFPRGAITIKLVTYPGKPTSLMRWTGDINKQWRDPRNWVEVITDNGREVERPVSYSPAECSNVIIPSSVNNFPELTDTAVCKNIEMKDRAMLKNPHVLKYDKAYVEFKLKPSELNRYVMWSAPLMNMYSGDYYYRAASGPTWGANFMNIFQRNNPDGGTAAINHFTASFAYLGYDLQLGQAFNLRVEKNTVTQDSLLRFPRSETAYSGTSGSVSGLNKTNSHKFITHGKNLNASGIFQLPVLGDINTSGTNLPRLVQVVNPYMAYLSVELFLQNNTMFQSGYYIWDGEVGTDMTAVALSNGNRITLSNPSAFSMSPALYSFIPPLQSFFVAKTSAAAIPGSVVNMSPNWTTTMPVSPSYMLRADSMVKSGGVMNMTISNGAKAAHAAMLYTVGASASFSDREDMPAVIHNADNESSLSLYTFSGNNIPLVINSNEHFGMAAVNLGFVVRTGGEYRLEFENLHSFGFDVVLVDKMLSYKQIDLMKTPEYTFTVSNPTGAVSQIEVNNRFELRFSWTGNGVIKTGVESEPPTQELHVSSGRGYLQVWSADQIGALLIYDGLGKLVYSSPNVGDKQLRIHVPGRRMYIVKAMIKGEMQLAKTIVK